MSLHLNKEITYRTAPIKEKEYLISDGGNLYMLVRPNGRKYWRFIYSSNNTRKKINFGTYPDLSLAEARNLAASSRNKLLHGEDLSNERAINPNSSSTDTIKEAFTFKEIATLWLESISHLNSPATQTKKIRRLEIYAFPLIGERVIKTIKPSEIYDILKPLIKDKKLETTHRLHGEISSIFDYAIVHDLTENDPAKPVRAQIPSQKPKHRAAIIDPKEFGRLLRSIDSYQGTFVVHMALKITPMLFQRPNEIRQMLWADINLESAEWRPFVSKTAFHHIVPLSKQAINILNQIKPLTGKQKYVFPSVRLDGRPMSDGTVITALKTLGYSGDVMTAHGFRTTASTFLNEQGWSPDAIERQLAHAPKDHVRAAYNRAQYLEERKTMMQAWADYLDELKAGNHQNKTVK